MTFRRSRTSNMLSSVPIESGRTARQLCAAAEEALAEAAFRSGEFTDAERLFGKALIMAGQDGDREAEGLAVGGLGMAHHHRNIAKLVGGLVPTDADVAAEEELMRRALAIWQELGHPAGTARALFGLGLVFQVLRRDWDTAMRYFWPSFGLAEAVEENGDLYGRSEIHRHLGFYYLVEDIRPHEAVRQLEHSLALREKLGDPRRIPSALVALGQAEMAAGNLQRAVELLRRALTLTREADLQPWRIQDAEQTLREAEAALSAASSSRVSGRSTSNSLPPVVALGICHRRSFLLLVRGSEVRRVVGEHGGFGTAVELDDLAGDVARGG
jgi:tetratricopeptide (TPR) repeat protein